MTLVLNLCFWMRCIWNLLFAICDFLFWNLLFAIYDFRYYCYLFFSIIDDKINFSSLASCNNLDVSISNLGFTA